MWRKSTSPVGACQDSAVVRSDVVRRRAAWLDLVVQGHERHAVYDQGRNAARGHDPLREDNRLCRARCDVARSGRMARLGPTAPSDNHDPGAAAAGIASWSETVGCGIQPPAQSNATMCSRAPMLDLPQRRESRRLRRHWHGMRRQGLRRLVRSGVWTTNWVRATETVPKEFATA